MVKVVELDAFPSLAVHENAYVPAFRPVHWKRPLPFPKSVNLSAPPQLSAILSPSGSVAETPISND